MSLATTNLMDTVKKQFGFKLKANIDAFSSLVGIQILAILFSIGGSASSGSFSDGLHLELKYYSGDLVIIFTMIWSFVTAITITTKQYRNQDFTFVSNRLSSSLSNILFLVTASLIGAVTAMLSRYLIHLIGYFMVDGQLYSAGAVTWELLLGMGVSLLYIFCISSFGYLIGALVQISKIFIVLIPVLFFGSLFLEASMEWEPGMMKFFQFYVMESSFLLFFVKMIVTTAIIFLASIGILNRLEVRR